MKTGFEEGDGSEVGRKKYTKILQKKVTSPMWITCEQRFLNAHRYIREIEHSYELEALMKGCHLKWFGSLLILAFLTMSCAGTKITQEYFDDSYTGKVSNILVIALIGSPIHQRNFEDEFVSQLHRIGVDAVSSIEVMEMPSDLILTKEMILDAVRKYNNDAVIITELVGGENKDSYRAGVIYYDFYGYYSAGYSRLLGTGPKSSNTTTVLLETMLFDVKTEKLIWAGISDTLARDPVEGQIQSDVIKAMVDKLQKSPLISGGSSSD